MYRQGDMIWVPYPLSDHPGKVKINNKDIETPLPKESEIRCNKIATIRKALILGKISSLKPGKLQNLIKQICRALK